MLIYLKPTAGKRIDFSYALKPAGSCSGASESIGSPPTFKPTDKKHKIFVKRAVLPFTGCISPPVYLERPETHLKLRNGAPQQDLNIFREVDRVVLDRFAPPCVLVDENLRSFNFAATPAPT
jgi:hypothetical protein